ncbi:MAG TPA: N-acyl homoserine lactonase family protein [Jatrophihabitans sp.]|jgi:N-acyl homoserine lactone hydrolase|uniref:N-acyl homoserine lactonase family protein n=1 Tax=Jatrophihabitans sp. TaxID=1932789 RepID=UPI002E073D19|nr:N-acyl homoserine lactonase family protein [Jatrophihabitans sp.]
MRTKDVTRIDLGTFVRPPEETGTGASRVEVVYGYLARTPAGLMLLDTGLGAADEETDAWYRPRRIDIADALHRVGVAVDDIALVVNCHLHFDHIGGNPRFAGRPIHCQRRELHTAQTEEYTFLDLVDFAGAQYEVLDGEAELAPGVHVIPTPGHVAGHQSVVLECEDGTLVWAGQALDTASAWSADVLAARARELGHVDPLPAPGPWLARILEFDPKRVVFAHDSAVWVP